MKGKEVDEGGVQQRIARLASPVWGGGGGGVGGRMKANSVVLALVLATFWRPCALIGGDDAGLPTVQILEPQDLSRLWVDEEHPVEIRLKAGPGADFNGGEHIRITVNGRDSGAEIRSTEQRLKIDTLDDGIHVIVAQLFDAGGRPKGVAARSTFYARMYLELIEHGDYPIAAEAPRGDGSVAKMPGIEEWDMGAGWNEWGEQTEDERLVRQAWGARAGDAGRPWDASQIFRVYADFHHQVMSNRSLWLTNDFLIYRTMDRGMGNQLESLVSAYVLALLTNRVFLVDSTTIHHVLKPPRGLSWHYSPLPDFVDHDRMYSRSKLLDFRWQNKLEFPKILCRDVKEAYTQQYLYIFSDQYFLPALLHNELYSETIKDWFGPDLFGTIARYLIAPKPYIMSRAASHARQHLVGKASIGIQLRTATMSGHDISMMANGMHPFAWKDWVGSFFKCSYFSVPPGLNSSYFLATDNTLVHGPARQHLGSAVNWIDQDIDRGKISGHVTALVDIVILSLCSDLVVTTMSTFGYVPAALSSIVPLVVTYHSTCYRELTSQPCFHKWNYLHDAACYDRHSMVGTLLDPTRQSNPPDPQPI